MTKYKYYFSTDNVDVLDDSITNREVFPVNGDNIDFDQQREKDQIFERVKLKTPLIFNGADYKFLMQLFGFGHKCTEVYITIKQRCKSRYYTYWTGKFSFAYCSVNEDDCVLTFTPDVNDGYDCFLKEGSSEYNMLTIPNIKTVKAANGVTLEYITCTDMKAPDWNGADFETCTGAGTNPLFYFPVYSGGIGHPNNVAYDCLPNGLADITTWQLFWNSIDLLGQVGLNYPITSVWMREVRVTLDIGGVPTAPAGTGWTNDSSVILPNGDAATKWVRVPYGGIYYNYNNVPGVYYDFLYGANCEQVCFFVPPAAIGEMNYTRGRSLSDVIQLLVDNIGCFDGAIVSDLFRINSDLVGADPDYVHGGPTQIDNIMMLQKSDVRDPLSTSPASKAMISFNGLMDILREEFQAYWKIVDGDLRIEHVSWFTRNQGLDTTLPQYDRFTNRTKRYRFLREEMPSVETFSMMEASNLDFVGEPITYPGLCVSRDKDNGTLEHEVKDVTTDLTFIQSDPDKIDDMGFVMLATVPEGADYRVIEDDGALTGSPIMNSPLSWANLHDKYFRHDRVQELGTLNGEEISFDTWKRTRMQEPFSIELCCDDTFNFNDLVKTKLGWGEVNKASFSTQTNKLKLTIYHY